ncbi:hypothetical protein mflW37_5710 [Mesoplasma florum W37]|uniref:Uncharacterized protein n=1 Tax=Mesoplasma florum TaxID=2151 RepID=A0AAD0HS98_MESFO|nr:hypothetical protein [Mesoplasma florum]AGY41638.1 hypothetical protein mflW37_5710 [Mesoplasma florum W37]AVN65976.1 hypothetical protein MflW12_5710 [Mesoplasma florum]
MKIEGKYLGTIAIAKKCKGTSKYICEETLYDIEGKEKIERCSKCYGKNHYSKLN